jgi:hypothetical protein
MRCGRRAGRTRPACATAGGRGAVHDHHGPCMRFTYLGVYSCARQSVGASTTAAAIGVVGATGTGITDVVPARHVKGLRDASGIASSFARAPGAATLACRRSGGRIRWCFCTWRQRKTGCSSHIPRFKRNTRRDRGTRHDEQNAIANPAGHYTRGEKSEIKWRVKCESARYWIEKIME